MVRPERIELPTSWFVAMRSIQLSYGRILVSLRLRIITETFVRESSSSIPNHEIA
jgi:hypothetical protein